MKGEENMGMFVGRFIMYVQVHVDPVSLVKDSAKVIPQSLKHCYETTGKDYLPTYVMRAPSVQSHIYTPVEGTT